MKAFKITSDIGKWNTFEKIFLKVLRILKFNLIK